MVRAHRRASASRDARESSAELDSGREFPALVEGRAGRRGIGIGDDEHRQTMGGRAASTADSCCTGVSAPDVPAAFKVAADSIRLAAPAAPITTMWRRLSSGFTGPAGFYQSLSFFLPQSANLATHRRCL